MNIKAIFTRKAKTTGLVYLSPASTLAAQLRASVILPMTPDEFRAYRRERSSGPLAWDLHQRGH